MTRSDVTDPILIGLTGRAGHGKSTVADIICDLVPHSEQYALAAPLKRMALAIDPLVWMGLTPGVHADQLSWAVEAFGWDRAKQFPSVRRFLQRLGTEGVRGTFGDDAWVDLMRDWWVGAQLDRGVSVGVISDVRYPNELEAVDVSIEVYRPDGVHLTGENAEHPSETGRLVTDYVITNRGTLDDLRSDVHRVLTSIGVFR